MGSTLDLAGLALLFPALGFLYCALVGRRSPGTSGVVGTLAVGASFVIALIVFFGVLGLPLDQQHRDVHLWDWIPAGQVMIPFGLYLDPLSAMMLLVVTGIGFIIHLYSIGYMHGDPGYSRFFAYMNLFVLAMLILVLANNFLLLMVGWNGVGFASYKLIAFWFERPDAASSGVKAFVTNAIGDVGLMIAVLSMFWVFGRLDYESVFAGAAGGTVAEVALTAIALLLLVAAIAKSGQVPLHVWLPDAMTGPTPVSALIHAATMVTAGVYLIARAYPIFEHAPVAMTIVAIVGAVTALLAATMGLVQWNIKRVLAYSTVSQLGLMFVALGVGAFSAAIFHLFTHAFFKALLFLGAGAVIHALHGEEDMRYMGGLKERLSSTYWTFVFGALALAGIPIWAGFWSKDEIIAAAFAASPLLGLTAVAVTFLTGFYIARVVFLTFHGRAHPDQGRIVAHAPAAGTVPVAPTTQVDHSTHPEGLHAPGSTLLIPLFVLALGSTVVGLLQLPGLHAFDNLMEGTFARFGQPHAAEFNLIVALVSFGAAAVGVFLAYQFYVVDRGLPKRTAALAAGVPYQVLVHRYFFDDVYSLALVLPGRLLAWLLDAVDRFVIDGAVNGLAYLTRTAATGVGWIQTGFVRNYALLMLVGVIVIVGYLARIGG